MKVQYLLYSKSLVADYRWLLIPESASSDEMIVLNNIFDAYDNYKASKTITDSTVKPIFCVSLTNIVALCYCDKTKYQDRFSRDIYCLQGIAVTHKQKKEFSGVLQYILDHYESVLNIWSFIDFKQADETVKAQISGKIDLELLKKNMSKDLEQIQNESHIEFPMSRVTLSFSKDGFQDLLRYVASSKVPLLDFAFGADPKITTKFNRYKIWAPIVNRG